MSAAAVERRARVAPPRDAEGRSSPTMAGRDGGHGARGAGKNGRKRLTDTDPDGLAEAHLFDVQRVWLVSGCARVDDPHDDAAEEQRPCHDCYAAEVLLTYLVQR